MWQMETHVSDVEPTRHPHRLVIGLDGKNGRIDDGGRRIVIQILRAHLDRQLDLVVQQTGLDPQEVRVGLQMHASPVI